MLSGWKTLAEGFIDNMGPSLHDGPFTMEKTVETVNLINTNLFEKCEGKL